MLEIFSAKVPVTFIETKDRKHQNDAVIQVIGYSYMSNLLAEMQEQKKIVDSLIKK